ncbi:MAG: DNA base-flipping protein [Bryobacteraceae bacterium]|nr:DNA base-flipping protein [Bryobacteraceae bacterium]
MPSTDYVSKVLAAVRRIPRGKVATYGDVAAAAGFPRAARGVAAALHQAGGSAPWQRVLGAGGRICLRGEDAFEQRLLLEAEGVRFRGARVDMKAHRFEPRGRARPKGGIHP